MVCHNLSVPQPAAGLIGLFSLAQKQQTASTGLPQSNTAAGTK
jgi:hypothetical protein